MDEPNVTAVADPPQSTSATATTDITTAELEKHSGFLGYRPGIVATAEESQTPSAEAETTETVEQPEAETATTEEDDRTGSPTSNRRSSPMT